MEQKLCRICGKLKDIENFTKSDMMRDGYRNECKECYKKLYYNKERIRVLNLEKEIRTEGKKTCRVCKEEKDINEFHLKRGTPDGHRNECKECVKIVLKKYKEVTGFKEKEKEYDKKRYEEKKEEILKRKKEYHIENRERILNYKKEYRSSDEYKEKMKNYLKTYRYENEDKLKEWRKNNKQLINEIQSRYRKNNPHCVAWRSILYSTLKRLGTIKEGKTIEMLGYSALELKEHLEKLFQYGMTWDNHGEWHIDHKIPVSFFDENVDIKIVCALDNLQPLWAFDNLSKNKY